jgi:hypothetical protein
MASVGPSRYAADSTAQYYHQAFNFRPFNTIAGVAPCPTPMPVEHQLQFKRSHESHGAGISTYR